MLARTTIDPRLLGNNITDKHITALLKVKEHLLNGSIAYTHMFEAFNRRWDWRVEEPLLLFNMSTWVREFGCGTVCCIGGLCEELTGEILFPRGRSLDARMHELFYPGEETGIQFEWDAIQPAQAAQAISNVVERWPETEGWPCWDEVLSMPSAGAQERA